MSDDDLPVRDDEDPSERDLARRSGAPAVGPWLIVGLILMLIAVVYVASALV